jgi:hypothetical protein
MRITDRKFDEIHDNGRIVLGYDEEEDCICLIITVRSCQLASRMSHRNHLIKTRKELVPLGGPYTCAISLSDAQ